MIRSGTWVAAKIGSATEKLLTASGAANTGVVAHVGAAGDCSVIFDGQSGTWIVPAQDLDIIMTSSSSAFKVIPEFISISRPACDCGAETARTTHARWCSTHGKV